MDIEIMQMRLNELWAFKQWAEPLLQKLAPADDPEPPETQDPADPGAGGDTGGEQTGQGTTTGEAGEQQPAAV